MPMPVSLERPEDRAQNGRRGRRRLGRTPAAKQASSPCLQRAHRVSRKTIAKAASRRRRGVPTSNVHGHGPTSNAQPSPNQARARAETPRQRTYVQYVQVALPRRTTNQAGGCASFSEAPRVHSTVQHTFLDSEAPPETVGVTHKLIEIHSCCRRARRTRELSRGAWQNELGGAAGRLRERQSKGNCHRRRSISDAAERPTEGDPISIQ
ncbi:hypothetical protein C8Q73DRAFT_117104 [Cubamyces lactineus]|nr:hypothetical protein C8Q73DRAFT_117104 [Cubamyces lactineus]